MEVEELVDYLDSKGDGDARIILYDDGSGHIEERTPHQQEWGKYKHFSNLEELVQEVQSYSLDGEMA